MSQPETEDLFARLAELETRVAEMEARWEEPGVGSLVRRLIPPEARRHLRAARKEQLLAARALIDHWIDRLEREPERRRRRRERIDVE